MIGSQIQYQDQSGIGLEYGDFILVDTQSCAPGKVILRTQDGAKNAATETAVYLTTEQVVRLVAQLKHWLDDEEDVQPALLWTVLPA